MSTLQQQMEDVHKAWLDFAYAVIKELGLIRLARRVGLKPKPWVLEREALEREAPR